MQLRHFLAAALAAAAVAAAEGAPRINQEGRILGPAPFVTNAILFDTTNADAVVSAMQIFPVTSAYNEDVSRLPVLANSDAMIAQIGSDLLSTRQTLRLFQEMNFVLVPDGQPLVSVPFDYAANQSDLNGGAYPNGLYPVPANMPIEGWPMQTQGETLAQAQTDAFGEGGDRHGIIVEPAAGRDFEMWEALLSDGNWGAANGAIFDLTSNNLRPAGWTSGDAAGLSMFAPLVRYDECERGMVEHACRLVVKRSLYNNYFYPATHFASYSTNTSTNLPSMGQRLRLKASFAIPGNWAREEKAVALGLKKYGALVADNGNFFSISIAPDDRWPAGAFDHITSVGITNFEVVQSTGPNGGPRSPGAPSASTGGDQTITNTLTAMLRGFVNYTGARPAILWTEYYGPGTATFGDATQTNTTAAFSVAGVYTLELSAADGIHAVAYDAAMITVTNAIFVSASRVAQSISLTWSGGAAPYVVDQAPALPASWTSVATTAAPSIQLPATNRAEFLRVRSH